MKTSEVPLPDDIILELFKHITDLDQLRSLCSLNRSFREFCSKPSNINNIAKHFLQTLQVNYDDPNNYIYIAHRAKMNNYKNADGSWKYNALLLLYSKSYSKTTIQYNGFSQKHITSFPIYPRMIKCSLSYNDLTSFPVQPNMESCVISQNKLTNFPVQPKMKTCNLTNNKLSDFPIQPNMESCDIGENHLTNFPVQPEMTYCDVSVNELTSFPIQPKMRHCDISSNPIRDFPIQPNMETFHGNQCKLVDFPTQPKMRICLADTGVCPENNQSEDDDDSINETDILEYMY